MRCETHGLAGGPDGRCALCARDDRRRSARLVAIITGGVFVAGVMGSVSVWAVRHRPAKVPDGPVIVSQSPAEATADPAASPVRISPARVEVTSDPYSRDAAAPLAPVADRDTTSAPQPTTAPDTDPRRKAQAREALVRAAMARVPVTVYVTPWCPACRSARAWLRDNGISHRVVDVEGDESASATLARLNPSRTIPTFDVAGTILTGFGPSKVRAAIRAAAEREVDRVEM